MHAYTSVQYICSNQDPEWEHEFTIEDRAFYETFLWTGRVLKTWAKLQEQVCQEALAEKVARIRTSRTGSGVHLGLLLSSFEEARSGPAMFGPEPRDQEVQRTASGSGQVEVQRLRKGVQGDATQARGKHWHGGGTCCSSVVTPRIS